MSDVAEFMDEAVGTDLGTKAEGLIPRKSFRDQANDSLHSKGEEGKEKRAGGLSQYAASGDKYFPTTDTVKTLPPDCYTLGFTPNGDFYLSALKLVTDNLMRLPDSRSDEVVEEIKKFWSLKDRFRKYGFAHKRGFLLWGPPGSGKTSTVAISIQDMIKAGGVVFIAEDPRVLSLGLKKFRTVEPERPLVVILEDIDTIIYNYGENDVLSILDGEAQVDNVVFIATTNYPEKLDGRVINRPSRFDRIVKIGLPNAEARAMYLKSKIEELHKDGFDLVKETDGLSIAHIKELIISCFCQGNDVAATLERIKSMKKTPKSDSGTGSIGIA